MATLSNSAGSLTPAEHPEARLGASPRTRTPGLVLLQRSLLTLSVIFFALHFVHLSADFPNFSRWMDWSKYTDEGWYGDAAIRHYQLGHWYVPGDFNPAAALPVWPFVEALLFHFTGVSLIAARALTVCVFGGILVASWVLVGGARSTATTLPDQRTSVFASIAVLLLAANPFCFVFTRLAILEPMLVLLTLAALVTAQRAKIDPRSHASGWVLPVQANALVIVGLGCLLPLLVLTKTTGLFVLPAIGWMLFASLGYGWRSLLQVGGCAAGLAATLWLGYFVVCVRPHYLEDYRYLFSANSYTKITASHFFSVVVDTFRDGRWFGTPLFACAIASTVAAMMSWRRLRAYPLIVSLLLWAFGYTGFLAYHNNLQPRYYLVVAVPLTLLVPSVFRDLVLPRVGSGRGRRAALAVGSVLFGFIVIPDALQTISIVRHPQYTLLSAARQIRDFIARDTAKNPGHSALVLSISGSELSLMTGLHSICDDFGTAELADRARQYNPGWYASWNGIEDDKMDALTPQFHVERMATFPAMDDPDRNLLVLYKLIPAQTYTDDMRHHRRRLRNKLGQQPSHSQLAH